MAKERTKALLVISDPVFTSHRKRIADHAAKQRLPTVSGIREYVEAGGLMAYGPSFPDMYRRAAYYVDRILKGTKPADLPVEQPMKFELVINLQTAKQIGLTIPQSVLYRADKVIGETRSFTFVQDKFWILDTVVSEVESLPILD